MYLINYNCTGEWAVYHFTTVDGPLRLVGASEGVRQNRDYDPVTNYDTWIDTVEHNPRRQQNQGEFASDQAAVSAAIARAVEYTNTKG